MFSFGDLESLKENVFYALITATNQYILGTRTDISIDDLHWVFMRVSSSNPQPGCINDGIGCVIDVRGEKPSYFTIIRADKDPIVRVIFERNVSEVNGPTIVDFIIKFDPNTTDYRFEVGFVKAPLDTEYSLHEDCQMMFGACLGVLKMMEAQSSFKMLRNQDGGGEE